MFATIVYVVYNLVVAKMVGELLELRTLAKEGLTSKAETITKEITQILEGEQLKMSKEVIKNTRTLNELLEERATEEAYNTFVEKLGSIVRDLYENYQFLQQNPAKDDFTSGHFLGFQVIREEYPVEYENLFRMAVDSNLDEVEISKRFVKAVKEGKVIPLGTAVIDEIQTGCSSILQAQVVRVNIVFGTPEYMAKQEEERNKRLEEIEKEKAEQLAVLKAKDSILNTLRLTEMVANELVDEVAEKHELTELVTKFREGLKAHSGIK